MNNTRPTDPLNDAKAQAMLRKWNEAQAPYRACDLCSRKRDGQTRDGHDAGYAVCVMQGEKTSRIAMARALGGHCGPEALHLDIPSWHAPKALPIDPHTASGFK